MARRLDRGRPNISCGLGNQAAKAETGETSGRQPLSHFHNTKQTTHTSRLDVVFVSPQRLLPAHTTEIAPGDGRLYVVWAVACAKATRGCCPRASFSRQNQKPTRTRGFRSRCPSDRHKRAPRAQEAGPCVIIAPLLPPPSLSPRHVIALPARARRYLARQWPAVSMAFPHCLAGVHSARAMLVALFPYTPEEGAKEQGCAAAVRLPKRLRGLLRPATR